ncbi:MAG: dihydrolipoamide dehydrogenase [Deltaproteobacteria bacterium RIFOXYD12_FULL_57_12]|nr:MAG: dihydrolipoamide dehydrogenase [Deltaproteobacteria bacterium RIFOXYD12_FULL_57_12]
MGNNLFLRKIAVAAALIAAVSVFFVFDLGRFLSLAYLKESHTYFADLYAGHRLAVIASYMVIYILATALSLPGAVIMTLAGGALFGLWVGIVVVSFASSIGATLACLVSRFLLREWVQARFGEKLAAINRGIEQEGSFYLFSLRLVPIFPFFIINLAMGLTRLPLSTYYWVSQVGMLPATVVYVNAGQELARIESLAGILSPGLLISFAVLGLFPIVTRKLLALYTARRPVGG